ncbi:hypothetical protein SHAb15599_00060 [Acinetobacter phage SH-Ab 15599]|nr:hypothetical protein SHAb15599_00060 [Acinetobacter phage SH-Ab 15599]
MSTDLQEQTIKNQETTLVFCEQATRLLADVKHKYTEAGEKFHPDDVAQLQEHINKQIQGYESLELYGGLEIKSAKVELVDEDNLKMTLGVIPKQHMFKNDDIKDSHFYLGWFEGADLYVFVTPTDEVRLRIRESNNPERDAVVVLATSQITAAKEARERLTGVYQHVV